MDHQLPEFLGRIATFWWLWAVVGVLLLDQVLRLASSAYRQQTDAWLRPGWRAALSLVAVAGVALASGYLVYRDSSIMLAEAQKRVAEAELLRPRLEIHDITTERLPDGTYKISKMVEIVSRAPPGRLHIAATARGITGLTIKPQSKRGMMIHGPSERKGDTITDRIQGPVGKYLLVIRAADDEVTLEHHFE